MSDLNSRLEKIEQATQRIEEALVGDQKFGHLGVIKRVEKIEAKVRSHDRKMLLGSGVILGIQAALEWVRGGK